MSTNVRVHFQNMERSPALEASINKHVEKLQRFYSHIVALHVTVEAPHQHRHKGYNYRVVIRISVPDDTLVVSHERGRNPAHEDCYVAIHDAFQSARRQLQDYARIRRHQVKRHGNGRRPVAATTEAGDAAERPDEPGRG